MTNEELSEIHAMIRPKTTEPLETEARAELKRRVDASSARAVARELAIGDCTVRRAMEGAALTRSLRNYLALMLSPSHAATHLPDLIAHAREDVPAIDAEVRRLSADLTAMTAAVHEYFAADAALDEAFANVRFAAPDMARQMAEEHSRAIVRAQTARRALREMAGMKR